MVGYRRLLLVWIVLVALGTSTATAASYTFVQISDMFSQTLGPPSINSTGVVAFVWGDNGDLGPYVSSLLLAGSGSGLTTLASGLYQGSPGSGPTTLHTFYGPIINDSGDVALFANYPDGQGGWIDGVYTVPAAGATLPTSVEDVATLVESNACPNCFDFNNAGQVAYLDQFGSGQLSLFTGGVPTGISTGVAQIQIPISLNSAGTAFAYVAGPTLADQGLYLFRSGQAPSPLVAGGFNSAVINETGLVVAIDSVSGNLVSVENDVVSPLLDLAAAGLGPLPSTRLALNDSGQVAFLPNGPGNDSVKTTLYVLADGELTRVLGPGDELFGGTVVRVEEFGPNGLNNLGQLAFVVQIEALGSFIVRADPVIVGPLDQTITFNSLPGRTFGGAPFGVTASASSGLAVSFAASGPCSVGSNTVTLTGVGNCTITVSQAGNATYNPAPDVPQTFAIAQANTTTSLGASPKPANVGQTVTLTATVTGPAPVTGSVTFRDGATILGTAAVSGTQAELPTATLAVGLHSLTAEYAGDGNHFGSTSSVFTLTILTTGRDVVEIAVSNPPTTIRRGGSFTVTDTTLNEGQAATTKTSQVQYYLSADSVKGAGDTQLQGNRAVGLLGPGTTSTGSVSVTVPRKTAAGTYRLLACADAMNKVPESNEGNNCLAAAATVQVTP